MDTVIYFDHTGKEVGRKQMEGRGRRPNEKDKDGNFVVRMKEGFKFDGTKAVPDTGAPKAAVPESPKKVAPPVPEIPKASTTEPPKASTTETPNTETVPDAVTPQDSSKDSGKMVIYLDPQGRELLRKPKPARGRTPNEQDKDGNYIVRIKEPFLAKFIKNHNLDGTAPATVLNKKDAEVFVDKVLNEKAEPDEALKEAATKAKEQKVEAPDTESSTTETPNTETPVIEIEEPVKKRRKVKVEPCYNVEDLVEGILHTDTEITRNPNGNVTILNCIITRHFEDIIEVLPFNAVFAKVEIDVQENSIKAWALPSDNKGNYAAPDRECYGCLKL